MAIQIFDSLLVELALVRSDDYHGVSDSIIQHGWNRFEIQYGIPGGRLNTVYLQDSSLPGLIERHGSTALLYSFVDNGSFKRIAVSPTAVQSLIRARGDSREVVGIERGVDLGDENVEQVAYWLNRAFTGACVIASDSDRAPVSTVIDSVGIASDLLVLVAGEDEIEIPFESRISSPRLATVEIRLPNRASGLIINSIK